MKKKLLKLKWMFLVLLFPFSAMAQNIYLVVSGKLTAKTDKQEV